MLQKTSSRTYFMVYAAAIAAIYTVLTMVFAPISFGPIQFRISEALCILPFLHRPQSRGCLSDACCPIYCVAPQHWISFLGVWLRSLGPWVPGCSAKQVGGLPSADPGKHNCYPMGVTFCIWLGRYDFVCNGNCRYW